MFIFTPGIFCDLLKCYNDTNNTHYWQSVSIDCLFLYRNEIRLIPDHQPEPSHMQWQQDAQAIKHSSPTELEKTWSCHLSFSFKILHMPRCVFVSPILCTDYKHIILQLTWLNILNRQQGLLKYWRWSPATFIHTWIIFWTCQLIKLGNQSFQSGITQARTINTRQPRLPRRYISSSSIAKGCWWR